MATLELRVDANGALQALRSLDSGLEATGTTADKTSDQVRRVALSASQYKALQAEINSSTRTLSLLTAATNKHDREAVAGLRTLIQQQKEWAQSVGASGDQLLKLALIQNRFDSATSGAALSTNKLHGGLRILATNITGLNPQVSQLATVLGGFALGGGVMVGVLAGLAAIAKGYDLLTSGAREAKKASDELIQSLLKQRQAAFDATIAGQQAQGASAQLRELQAQQRLEEVRAGTRSTDPGIRIPALLLLKGAKKELEDASAAYDQTRINVQKTVDDEAKKAAAERKRLAQETEAAENKALARLRERVAILSKIKIDFGGVQGAFDAIGQGPIRLPFEPVVSKTPFQDEQDAAAALRRGQDQLDAQRRNNAEAWAQTSKDVKRFGEATRLAAQTISQAVEYWLVQKLGGGTIGGNLGAGIGKAASTALGGFGGTAIGQAIFGPIAAGLGAAIGGVVDSLFDFSGNAKAAARALKEARESLDQQLADFSRRARGTEGSLDAQIEAARREANMFRDQAQATFGPSSRPWWEGADTAALAQRLAQIAADEAIYVARLREESELKQQMFKEDLQVRLLRAQGREDEADRLAQQLAQQREMAELVKAGADAATIALLGQVHAAEYLKKTIDDLSTTVRNAPSGFKVESYINRFAIPRAGPFSAPPLNTPYSPIRPGMPNTSANAGTTVIQFREGSLKGAFVINGNESPEEIATKVAAGLRIIGARTAGINVLLADVLDYA